MFPLPESQPLGALVLAAHEALARDLRRAGLDPGPAPPPGILGGDFGVTALNAAPEPMGPGSLSFATEARHLAQALGNSANGIITSPALAKDGPPPGTTFVVTPEPRLLFASVLNVLEASLRPRLPQGEPIFLDRDSCAIGEGVAFGPWSYVGRGVRIGARATIGPYVFLEDEAEIGEDTVLHPRVTVRWRAKIGSRCIIHAGSVIGGDGFGYSQVPVPGAGRLLHYRNAHLGSVSIGDEVEIGSLTAVDRGMVEDTVVSPGSKLDNLVQIGHNARIGRDAIVVSQVGVAGHVRVGDRAFLLGQVGLSHGVVIGEDAILTGQAGVTGRIPPGRRAWGGTPARPMSEYLGDLGLVHRHLPLWRKFLGLFKKSESFEELKGRFLAGPGGPDEPGGPERP